MADLRFFKFDDGKKWYKENTIKKEIILKDNLKEAKEKKEIEKLKRNSNLSKFGDKDKDRILNVFDRQPFKKNKRSKWGIYLR